jgi:foldase protein PrsA
MSRTIRIAAAVGTAALCASLAACANSSGGGTAGGNIATVNGQAITRADFDKKLESSPAARQALNQMVQQDLIDQYARDKKVDVSDAEIDKKLTETKARFPAGQFEQILKQQGLSEADVRQILKQQIVLEKAVAPQVKVSDADIKAYFDKNHAVFDKPEQIKARHVLVADAKTAQIVMAKLKAKPNDDANWAAVAKQYSTDPSSKDKGGELGYFGRGQMVPAFQDAAFAAKVGQIVGPVKSPFGYHVIQVEDRKPAQKATLASAHDQIKTQLTTQQQSQQVPLFLQSLRSSAKIDVYDDRFKDVFPPTTPASAAPASAAPPSAAPAAAPTK